MRSLFRFRAPDSNTVMDYPRAVPERIREYIIHDLSESELGRESYSPTFDRTGPVGIRITGVISDGLQHVGQAAYVRSLIKGQG